MSVTLKGTGCECHNDDRAFEVMQIIETIFVVQLERELLLGCGRHRREDANRVDALQSANLAGGLETIHHWELNIHEDQVKATGAPLLNSFSSVHGCLPAYLEALDKGFEQLQIDGVVFDDEYADRGHRRDHAVAAAGKVDILSSLRARAGGTIFEGSG